MHRDQKPKEVKALQEKFEKAKSIVFAQNKGLKVSEITELRKSLRKEKATMKVVKNRLLRRALADAKIEGLDIYIEGATTITASEGDAVVPVKLLVNFAKENERLEIKGGYLAGETLDLNKVKALAELPSREVLYAKLLGCLMNPATQLTHVLVAIPRQLVTVIEAIRKQKGSTTSS